MACGGDIVCEIANFVGEHGLFLNEIANLLNGAISGNTEGLPPEVARVLNWLRENFANLVSLSVGALGIWKWWHYREKILHLRLAEYLADQDRRLDTARSDLMDAINRPAPGKKFSDPIFADQRLRRVLRERRWDFDIFGRFVTRSVNSDLDEALNRIDSKLEAARNLVQNFQHQQASVHLLRGAVAAAEAGVTFNKLSAESLNKSALLQFRAALAVPGFEQDIQSKEFEAHQFRKLMRYEDARASYEVVIRQARNVKDARARDLLIARCKRYLGELQQVKALGNWLDGQNANGGSWNSVEFYRSALKLRKKFGPFNGWDAMEQAELHYLMAYAHNRLGNTGEERSHLNEAANNYESILRGTSLLRSVSDGGLRRLRRSARNGLEMVTYAQPGKADTYDIRWLGPVDLVKQICSKQTQPAAPASNNPQNDTQPVGTAGGNESVSETAKQDPINEA